MKHMPRAFAAACLALSLGTAHAQASVKSSCEATAEPIRLAGITWESGQFFTEIIRHLIEKGYGCKTEVVNGSTAATEAALVSGNLQIWAEQWNRTDIIKKGQELGKITLVGDLLQGGAYEGFFVPEYVIHGDARRGIQPSAPDLRSVADLPRYKALFADDEEPGKGRLLSCPVGWDCERINGQKLKAYGLERDYTHFRPGTGAALDAAITSATERGKPVLFYYWSPAGLMGKYRFVQLQEPAFNPPCWDTLRTTDAKSPCPSATPRSRLTVGVTTGFAKAHPDLVRLIERVQLSGSQINAAIVRMTEQKLRADTVAREFLLAQPTVWSSWTDAERTQKILAALK